MTEPKPDPARPVQRRRLRHERDLALLFTFVAMLLVLLLTGLWFFAQQPALRAYAESNARALAQARASDIETVLAAEDTSVEHRRAALETAVDGLLLPRNQSSGQPFMREIEIVLDYDAYPAPAGSLDLQRCAGECGDCFVTEVPLYHRATRQLIGVASFCASTRFVEELMRDIGSRLFWVAGVMLVLIGVAWLGTSRLLRRLGESESNLRMVFEAAPFPILLQERGVASITRANRAAIEFLGLGEDGSGRLTSGQWEWIRTQGLPREPGERREIEIARADGEPNGWALASAIPVRFSGQPSDLISFADISALKATQSELHQASITDPLTGLANRRHLLSTLHAELQRAARAAMPVSVMLLDLDHFKQVNDTLGHGAGDEVLRAVATILRRFIREQDTAGRFGGEEFLIILPGADDAEAATAAERIRVAVGSVQWPYADLRITVSIGVAGHEGDDAHALLERVDERLYAAKRQGRDRIVVAPRTGAH